MTFDSTKEFRRFQELSALEATGEISNLQRQVKYSLLPSFRDEHTGRVIERECNYIADFVYLDRYGNTVVEDTKGFRTPEYIIKRKMMLHFHKVRIREV